jgi:hypothetical protein
MPTEPQFKTIKQLYKMEFHTLFDNDNVFFVHFLFDECQHFLKKLIELVEFFYSTMKLLIISMPQESTYLDDIYAKRIVELVKIKGGTLHIMFVKHEDRMEFINKVFRKDSKKCT